MNEATYLVGYADPLRKGIGFLIPVFDSREHNALLVQRLAADDRIVAFEPVEALDAPITHVVREPAEIGEEAIWAFAFAPDDILAERGARFREALQGRIDDPALAGRPLLSVEVAEFLELPARRIGFAKAAYERLRALGSISANSWRDLSILTPDLRRAVARSGGETGALAKRLIAQTDGNAVTIRTAVPVGDAAGRAMATIARRVLDGLSDLYVPPRSGWAVHFSNRGPGPRTAQPEALVLLAGELDREVGRYLDGDFAWRIDAYAMQEFPSKQGLAEFKDALAETGAPGFVVVRGEGERPVAEALREAGPGVVAIQFGTNPRFLLHRANEEFNISPPLNRIYVPSTGLFGSGFSAQTIAATVRQIAAATLAGRDRFDTGVAEGKWVYFRANGSGLAPHSDAIATLYDRLLANNLSGEQTLFLSGRTRPSRVVEDYPGWAREALFPSATPLRDRRIVAIMENGRSRTDAAMLLPVQPRGERDREEHRRAIERVLSFRGWRVEAKSARTHEEMPFEIDVPLRLLYLLGLPEPVDGSTWDLQRLLELDLRELDTVALTGSANAASILARLQDRRQLAINMRDLCGSTPEAGLWSLFGGQLRRMASGQMNRARSHYLALLLNQAFRTSHVDIEEDGALYDAICSPTLGKAVQLSWSRVNQTPERTIAEVRLLAGESNEYLRGGSDLVAPFAIILRRDGIEIARQK